MSETKYLKQIQSRLSRRDIKVSYDQIRPVLLEYCPDIDIEQPTPETLSAVVQHFIDQSQTPEITLSETDTTDSLSPDAEAAQLPVTAESNSLITTKATDLQAHNPHDHVNIATQELAPQEAIAIIQEIASDDTSRNQQLAEQLLTQAHEKTDTIVALIGAMPDIEAEMLKRKLQKMQRKRVDYQGILDSHFRQSQNLTTHIQGLVSEYGISI